MGIGCMKVITPGSQSISWEDEPVVPSWHVERVSPSAFTCLSVRRWPQALQDYLERRRHSLGACLRAGAVLLSP